MMLGQLGLEAGMLSREGTGSLKRKRKLQPVNSRQENYTKLMNYDQFAAWLWKTDFGKEGFGLLRMQIWNPDYPSCDLSFVGVPSLLPSPTRAGLGCASSQPLSSASAGSNSLEQSGFKEL